MDINKMDATKAKQITALTMEMQDLRFDLKQYAKGAREAIKEREAQIKRLTETIQQPDLFEGET